MIPNDPRLLIGGHITGSLNKSESDHLMKRALADQNLFDELLALEPLRGALQDAELRSQIQADLRERMARQPISFFERLRRLLFKPVMLPALSLVAAAVVVMLIRQGVVREDSGIAQVTLGPDGVPLLHAAGILETRPGEAERLRQVQAEPATKPGAGAIAFDRGGDNPAYRVGDAIRIAFRVPRDASVMMIEERSDGTVTRLFPNRYQSSAQMTGGETILVPPNGQGPLEIEGPPGRRTVRVLVFPPNVDPLDFGQPWDTMRRQATVLEKSYEVLN